MYLDKLPINNTTDKKIYDLDYINDNSIELYTTLNYLQSVDKDIWFKAFREYYNNENFKYIEDYKIKSSTQIEQMSIGERNKGPDITFDLNYREKKLVFYYMDDQGKDIVESFIKGLISNKF